MSAASFLPFVSSRGMLMSGFSMRLTRSMILEVLRQDCVRITWTKGLRERVVTELIIALS